MHPNQPCDCSLSINKKVKFKCQIDFKILSILDTRPYALIIGRPDILLGRFASQWQMGLVSDTRHDAEEGHTSMPSNVEYGLVDICHVLNIYKSILVLTSGDCTRF